MNQRHELIYTANDSCQFEQDIYQIDSKECGDIVNPLRDSQFVVTPKSYPAVLPYYVYRGIRVNVQQISNKSPTNAQ